MSGGTSGAGGGPDRPGLPSELPEGDPLEPELDWFGFPVERPRRPVPCPRCGATFVDRAGYATHLVEAHDVRPPRRRRRTPARDDQPVPGRDRRSATSSRLRTVPLVLVLACNVALILIVVGVLATIDPPWWRSLVDDGWSWFAVIPLLWPTVAFLALRGVD